MLAEYMAGRDVAELARCLAELDMPFFNHEFVKQTVELAFEQVQAGITRSSHRDHREQDKLWLHLLTCLSSITHQQQQSPSRRMCTFARHACRWRNLIVSDKTHSLLPILQASAVDSLSSLLSSLSSMGSLSATQMTKGFLRIKGRLDEEAIDFGPLAQETFGRLVTRGTKEGWLSIDPEA